MTSSRSLKLSQSLDRHGSRGGHGRAWPSPKTDLRTKAPIRVDQQVVVDKGLVTRVSRSSRSGLSIDNSSLTLLRVFELLFDESIVSQSSRSAAATSGIIHYVRVVDDTRGPLCD
jgi:hypothetical protein